MTKKLIQKKLIQLQQLLQSAQEVQIIDPDNPETWDSDALYNLVETLKGALQVLEGQTDLGKYDEYGDPLILETGLCSLVDDYQDNDYE